MRIAASLMTLCCTLSLMACGSEESDTNPAAEVVCGDGLVARSEQCDDGNTATRDGCNEECEVQDGYRCEGEPSDCFAYEPECGNGIVDRDDGERCDDDNTDDGDGCAADCTVEDDFDCDGEPSVCDDGSEPDSGGDGGDTGGPDAGGTDTGGQDDTGETAECGDGVITAPEACDDDNTAGADGCSSACTIETGYTCAGEPSVCTEAGECNPAACAATAGPCEFASCSAAGECIVRSRPDGADCASGDVCAPFGECVEGECVAEPLDCSGLDGDCVVGVCDAESGGCVAEPIPEGGECGITDECGSGTCIDGTCVRESEPDCTPCEGGTNACVAGFCGGLEPVIEHTAESPGLPEGFTSTSDRPWIVDSSEVHSGAGAFRAGSIDANGISTLTWTVDVLAPATLTFWYNVSSESCCDDFLFAIDGREVFDDAGESDWVQLDFEVEPGRRVFAWTYDKDGSLDSGSDTVWIDDIRLEYGEIECDSDECGVSVWGGSGCVVCPVRDDGDSCSVIGSECMVETCEAGRCVAENLHDCTSCADGADFCASGWCGGPDPIFRYDFEAIALPEGFTTGGNIGWARDTSRFQAGASAWRSGAIASSQTSTLTRVVTLNAPGRIDFWYSTSTESCCDKLRFSINGTERLNVGGEVAWTRTGYDLPAGTHTLVWSYTKDGSLTGGSDAVWIDEIVIDFGALECVGDACGTGIWNGTGCSICPIRPDGTSCDEDGTDCIDQACEDGRCVIAPLDDCTTCGTDGSDVCAGGLCGGQPPIRTEGFVTATIPEDFVTTGDASWFVDPAGGRGGSPAIRAGDVGALGRSYLEIQVTVAETTELGFWYRVSSQACCDKLEFRIDRVTNLSTATDVWTRHTYTLEPGTHELLWVYQKDNLGDDGADTVWLDDIELPGVTCEGAECALEVSDGSTCISCPAPDGLDCTGGSCAAGICEGSGAP